MITLEEINDKKLSEFDYTDFIGIPLTKKDKQILCKLLDLRNNRNVALKWQSVKLLLDNYYLKVIDKTIRIARKQVRVSYIIDELEKKR